MNAQNCAVITRNDLDYWGIDDLLLEPCCAVKYYPEIEICQNELDMEEDENRKEAERERLEDFGPSLLGRTRKYLWDLFEYPQTSRGAQVGGMVKSVRMILYYYCNNRSCLEIFCLYVCIGRTPFKITNDAGDKKMSERNFF